MAHFTSDGLALAYDEFGPADARKAIVLVHGFSANRYENWKRMGWYDAIAAKGLRGFALDNRGHGESAKPHDPAQYSREAMARDVFALMDHAGVERAHLLGFSMGSHIALTAALTDSGRIDHLVVPTGSGGTHAGILAGIEDAGLGCRVRGVSVSRSAEQAGAIVSGLVNDIYALEGRQRGKQAALEIDDSQVGPGYGQPTPAMIEAVELVARTEGILLDPVYTGKAMAGLVALVRSGAIGPDETVVFWHTGGAPGLYAYPEVFQG